MGVLRNEKYSHKDQQVSIAHGSGCAGGGGGNQHHAQLQKHDRHSGPDDERDGRSGGGVRAAGAECV